MSEVERVVELTAREICKGAEVEFNRQIKESIGPDEWPDANCYDFSVVLTRRLLPLLEAGQAMRSYAAITSMESAAYDAALAEAGKEQK